MKKSLLVISALAACSLMSHAEVAQGAPVNLAETNATSTTTEAGAPLLLPLTSARQLVDGGKYIIAAYNHHWGTENHADMRFLKFENNKSKYVSASDVEADAASVIWTAHTAEGYTCTSTVHGYSSIVTFSHGDQYLKLNNSGTPTEVATSSTNTNSCNIFELTNVAAPTGAPADKAYFELFYDKAATRAWFYRNAWVSHQGKMGYATYPNVDTGLDKRQYQSTGDKWSTYYRVWHVMETEGDLAKHAKGYKEGRQDEPTTGNGVGQFTITFPDGLDAFIENENSTDPITQEDLDNFNETISQTVATLNMPKPGTYLKFNGSSTAVFRQKVELFYNTEHGTGNTGRTRMNLDKTHNGVTYSDAQAVMYYDNDNLLSYSSGYYLGATSTGFLEFKSSDDMATTNGNLPVTIGIVPGTNNGATYQVNYSVGSSSYGLHINGSGSSYWFGDRCGISGNLKTTTHAHAEHDWTVTQVSELPVTLGEDGFGSFYAPVAVSFGDGVTAYTATYDGSAITFSEVGTGEVVPPSTPVVLKGTAGATVNATINYDYTPEATPDAQTETASNVNLFGKIAVEKLTATEGTYTFRPTTGDNNAITMEKVETGNCLPVNSMLMTLPDDCPLINSEDGTVTLNLEQPNNTTGLRELNAADAAADSRIYDLQGRRLAAPLRGLNIINGRKVLIK